ncbi:hypothetical protein ACFO4M_31905, partial [Pseudonocardia nematodicida]
SFTAAPKNSNSNLSFYSGTSNDTNHGTLGENSINYSNMQLHDNRDITDLTTHRDPDFSYIIASSEEFNIQVNNGEARLGLDYDKDNSLIRMFLKYKTVGKRKLF